MVWRMGYQQSQIRRGLRAIKHRTEHSAATWFLRCDSAACFLDSPEQRLEQTGRYRRAINSAALRYRCLAGT